ncbi:TetR/AcrR family transcriptional regulator, partial [Pseudoclavibacter helvolus]|uniref:TetR/AcrR family transcriptional regulator n=1 Tax=Pseudoclavibacter helvolus TaxID=255205 RepID=UPI0024AD01A7
MTVSGSGSPAPSGAAAGSVEGSAATRTQAAILAALIDVIEEVGSDEVSYKLIARRAGIAERTVFRYYPTRAELLVAAGEWIELHAFAPPAFASVFDLPIAIRASMASYDARPELAHLAAESAMRGASPPTLRFERIRTAVEHELAWVEPAAERRRIAAALGHLDSAATWVILRRELGLATAALAPAPGGSAEGMR